jgi:LysM repeat protein
MAWGQLIGVDETVTDQAGWCARFQWKSFYCNSAIDYETSIDCWNGSQSKHPVVEPPAGVSVPIYYSWRDMGHSATWVAGKGVLSSPGEGYGQQWFRSIEECGRYFGASYLGWTEDMAGVPVVQYIADPAPAPAPEPTPGPTVTTYTVVPEDNLWGIAERFYGHADWDNVMDIANANGIENPALIFPGQTLTIPGI